MVEEPKEIINTVQEEQPKISLDYIAGLYDSRGIILITRTKTKTKWGTWGIHKGNYKKEDKEYILINPSIYIKLDYINKDILARIKGITNGKVIISSTGNGRKPAIVIKNIKGMRDFLLTIGDKSILKKEHSKRLLEYTESRLRHLRSRLTKREIALVREIITLNKYLPLPEEEL